MRKLGILILLVCLLSVLALSAEDYTIYTEILGTTQMYDEEGNLTGSSVEIVKEIQNRIGDDTAIEPVPWARGYNAIQQRDNVILFSTTLTEERRPMFKWVGPVVSRVWMFYTRKGSGVEINSLGDAKKLESIGTYKEDVREQFLLSEGFENLDSSSSNVINVKKLNANRLAAVIDSPESFVVACEEAGIPYENFVEEHVVRETELYITFSKNFDQETFNEWKNALKEMYADGTFEEIYKEWYPNAKLPEFNVIE